MARVVSNNAQFTSVCVVLVTIAAVSDSAFAVDLEKDCVHLTEHLAIDQKLHDKLKLDQVRVRCGKRTMQNEHSIREVTLFRMPAHESSIRLDRFTGRLLTITVDRLPIPELAKPKGGWPSLVELAEIVRTEAEIPADGKLVKAYYVARTDDGLVAGQHPYAQFVFEHTVEGAYIIGDQIVARLDLRSKHLVWLDARRWTHVKSPDSRTTEGRALRTAKKALKRLDPAVVPCCQDPHSGETAGKVIGAAISGKKSKRKSRRARKRRRRGKGPKITCEPRHRRRVYLHDRKGKLVEAYEVACVPTCNHAGVTRRCAKKHAVMSYVATKSGKLLGMKGDIAPERYKWRRPPPPKKAPLAQTKLDARATKLLQGAIERVEPLAELKSTRCPPTEDDPTVVRRCHNLMLPAMHYRARQTRKHLVFEMAK